MMAKTVTVQLADREYTISALPIRRSKAWREQLAMPFAELTRILEGAGNIEINQFGDIAALVRTVSGTLLGAVDQMLHLMFEYSPELAADREYIEENAYDEEALVAFTEVLKLAYPLGRLLAVVTGRQESLTSSNSLSRNGASGTTHRLDVKTPG